MEETCSTREGEQLEEARLRDFLGSSLDVNADDLEIRQFPAGSSNLTYLVKFAGREYVLRRPPFGNRVKTAHDMKREFEVLSKLSTVYVPAPKPVLFCDDNEVLGCDFYLMERKEGLILRGNMPPGFDGSDDEARQIVEAFVENLANLHSIDLAAAGLGEFGHPAGYTQRQVVGWSKRYFNVKTDQWDELEEAVFWLNNNIPGDFGAALIHNDYKFDNVILDPSNLSKLTGVLDWEMATVGNPLMDLGTTLGYWMSAEAGEDMMSMPFNPRFLMERVSRQEIAEWYSRASGADVDGIHFYYIFGTVKIAVIAQQIYFRFKRGHTRDPRFAGFGAFVGKLGSIAASSVRSGKI